MSIFLQETARDCEALDGQHSSGHQEAGNELLPRVLNFTTEERQRILQRVHYRTECGCKKYWADKYGAEAERASRGGVAWVCGGFYG